MSSPTTTLGPPYISCPLPSPSLRAAAI
jgi:hypothetical protein